MHDCEHIARVRAQHFDLHAVFAKTCLYIHTYNYNWIYRTDWVDICNCCDIIIIVCTRTTVTYTSTISEMIVNVDSTIDTKQAIFFCSRAPRTIRHSCAPCVRPRFAAREVQSEKPRSFLRIIGRRSHEIVRRRCQWARNESSKWRNKRDSTILSNSRNY